MKNIVFHPSFLLLIVLFLMHQFCQKVLQIPIPWVDSYFDPFCLGALVPTLFLLEKNILFKQTKLSDLEIIILAIFLIFTSELILPYFFSQFVTDALDALMILLGIAWIKLFHPADQQKQRSF